MAMNKETPSTAERMTRGLLMVATCTVIMVSGRSYLSCSGRGRKWHMVTPGAAI